MSQLLPIFFYVSHNLIINNYFWNTLGDAISGEVMGISIQNTLIKDLFFNNLN